MTLISFNRWLVFGSSRSGSSLKIEIKNLSRPKALKITFGIFRLQINRPRVVEINYLRVWPTIIFYTMKYVAVESPWSV